MKPDFSTKNKYDINQRSPYLIQLFNTINLLDTTYSARSVHRGVKTIPCKQCDQLFLSNNGKSIVSTLFIDRINTFIVDKS